MRHHIAVKFLAVMLCALFLLTAVGSGLGILAMTTSDLYEKTVDEVYEEAITSLSDAFAGQIATRYASRTLGDCSEEMLEYYGKIFNSGYYGYQLKDADGNVLEQVDVPEYSGSSRHFSIPVTGRSYQKLISVTPESELNAPTEEAPLVELFVIDNIPGDDVLVDEVFFYTNDGYDCSYADEALGVLYHTTNGDVYFQAHDPNIRLHSGAPITQASFFSGGKLLYQITCADGVGTFAVDDNGLLSVVFHQPESAEATRPAAPSELEYIYNAIPYEGVEVQRISFAYLGYAGEVEPGSETYGTDGVLGQLFTKDDGAVVFYASDPQSFSPRSGTVTFAAFYGTDGKLLYETYCPGGAGSVFDLGDGYVINDRSVTFESWLEHYGVPNSAADSIPNTTAPATETPTEAPTEAPSELPAETATEDVPTVITDNLEQLGVQVAVITIFDEHNYTGGIEKSSAFGYLSQNADGTITFRSYKAMAIPEHPEPILRIAFGNAEGWLLYEVQSSERVGGFTQDSNGCLIFTSTVMPEEAAAETDPSEAAPAEAASAETQSVEAETIPEESSAAPEEVTSETVVPDTANIIAEVTEPTTAVESPDTYTTHYWDNDLQEYVQAIYTYEDIPEGYTLELWLLPGAYEMDPVYDLLQFAWQYRNELFYVLGVSTLLFAVFAVYLCCAAGRKPGSKEILPGGFNCLPLDIYLTGGAFTICGLVILCVEGGYYLFRNSPHVIPHYILIAGYLAALIIVGFCFACAAQLKTSGGYWWKNTLCARFIRMIARLAAWLERFLGKKVFPFLGRAIRFCWRNGKRAVLALFRYTEMFLTWFVQFTVRCSKYLWKHGSRLAVISFHGLESGLTWLGRGLGKIAQRTYAWFNAFLSLLPVTWQWLIIGGMLLFILFLSILTRSEGWILLGGLAGLALVLYGSHCFGILWDSTRKMSKGDLETKVDDRLMIGAFKEFAADLNALGDVAIIAAQKQMQSERMKTELITNVSHDIKTPLTSIISYVDLLQKPHTAEEQEQYLEVLSRQSLRMKKLLEDLIEMSKASTGNMSVTISRINAAEAVTQALGEFADKLAAAQLSPMVQQPEAPLYMQADGRLVWRVLSNLLGNVVKYALPGTRVYIDVMELEGHVLISLKNISREALNVSAEELMERFVRGDASRNAEGSGLGLNIARSLMEIQHGNLDLVVDGDLFKVTLCFPKSEA